ncbi:MAG: hypothetical protein FJ102_18570 [Deltaproteobacteria bacterium]|nr:hypothetical protein [Deltaproteobacteria bacterium]
MLLLLACIDDPALFDEADISVLFSEPTEDFDQRASMSRPGYARLGTSELPNEAIAELVAVFDPGDEVGAIVEDGGLRYLAHVERDALVPTVAERSRVRASRVGEARSGPFDEAHDGAWLAGGSTPLVTELGPRFSRVEHYSRYLWVDGWMPTGEIDEVWTPSPPLYDAGETDLWLPGAVNLHEGPGGAVFAHTAERGWASDRTGWVPATTLAQDGGWRRVRIDDRGLVAIGWVDEREIEIDTVGGWFSCGCCGGWGGWGRGGAGAPSVPADTVLYDGPGGAPVARALEDLWLPTGPSELGGRGVTAFTPWGEAELWMDEVGD